LCPEISIITRSGTPALLKLLSAVRRIECVEAPLILTRLQAFLKITSDAARVKGFVLSRPGNKKPTSGL
jgi:hypothetical protein